MTVAGPLLARRSTEEFAPLPATAADRKAEATVVERVSTLAPQLGASSSEYLLDRRGTAVALRAIDAAHGGGFYPIEEAAEWDADAAASAFAGGAPVVDVQTHLVDPALDTPERRCARGVLQMVDHERWGDGVDPERIDAGQWAALVFGTSETKVALLTSTPGSVDDNVLTNPQIGAAREVVDRYAGSGRVLTHTIVHPNLGEAELERMGEWQHTLDPSGWKVYTLYGPPTSASPTGGWFLDDDEVGMPFLQRVAELGPRVVAAHKGLGGPVPGASVAAASPRDIGPAARAFPAIDFVVYHSGYERDPDGQEGPYESGDPGGGVDRLLTSVRAAGIGPEGNVYAELGSTWYLMLRRPAEAAHVLGKLLSSLGPDRIIWGTDSVWYGSPQPLIDAFRAFVIPESYQERFGYPRLTRETKDKILSHNAARLRRLRQRPRRAGSRRVDRRGLGRAPQGRRRVGLTARARRGGRRPGRRLAQGAKEAPDVLHQEVRLLRRGKVSTPRHDRPARQVGVALGQAAGDEHEIVRKHRDGRRGLDGGGPVVDHTGALPPVLPVVAHGGADGPGDPVQHHARQEHVPRRARRRRRPRDRSTAGAAPAARRRGRPVSR